MDIVVKQKIPLRELSSVIQLMGDTILTRHQQSEVCKTEDPCWHLPINKTVHSQFVMMDVEMGIEGEQPQMGVTWNL